jgi:hypothetical protein
MSSRVCDTPPTVRDLNRALFYRTTQNVHGKACPPIAGPGPGMPCQSGRLQQNIPIRHGYSSADQSAPPTLSTSGNLGSSLTYDTGFYQTSRDPCELSISEQGFRRTRQLHQPDDNDSIFTLAPKHSLISPD